jgi:hypothetical protein
MRKSIVFENLDKFKELAKKNHIGFKLIDDNIATADLTLDQFDALCLDPNVKAVEDLPIRKAK